MKIWCILTAAKTLPLHLPETFHKNKCSVHHQFIIIGIDFYSILANSISNSNKTLCFGRQMLPKKKFKKQGVGKNRKKQRE